MCKLQPIKTAPKDGSFIILFGPSGYTTTPLRCSIGRWCPEYRPLNPWQTHSHDAFTDSGDEPTHWTPLPEPEESVGEAYEPAYRFQEFYIPAYMMDGLARYIEKGIPPGDFLTAIITNDFGEAVMRADDVNMKNLPAYAAYFYNKAPAVCHGSKEKMARWMEIGGMEGWVKQLAQDKNQKEEEED